MQKHSPSPFHILCRLLVAVCLLASLAACSDTPLFGKPVATYDASDVARVTQNKPETERAESTAPAVTTTAAPTTVPATEPTTAAPAHAADTIPATTAAVVDGAAAERTTAPPTTETTTAAQDETVTVYVSRRNVIHSRCDCSGMRYYTEKTLSEALENGGRKCQHCW